MNLYAAAPDSLWSSPAFVRFMAGSVAAHAAVIFFVVYGPIFRFNRVIMPQPVMINLAMEAPAEPAPPDPAPPEPPPPAPEVKPPEPKPPEPEPAPPKQEVEEALVVPDVPAEKPKPKPPKPPKLPDQKPKQKPPDVTDVMASLRKDVEKQRPAPTPRASAGANGVVDPELAAYQLRVRACLNANWAGAQLYQRRRDLQVQFLMRVNATGRVQGVEVMQGSGEDALDDSAERAILKCSPSLPPPPSGITEVPITFSPGDIQ